VTPQAIAAISLRSRVGVIRPELTEKRIPAGAPELVAQEAARAQEPDANGAGLRFEDLREGAAVEIVPVVELEEELLLCGDPSERRADPIAFPLSIEPGTWRRGDLCDRYLLEVYVRAARQSPQGRCRGGGGRCRTGTRGSSTDRESGRVP
jgi:hypothetical protein